jgi:hypothetical protein
VELIKRHPEWRVQKDRSSAALKIVPQEGRLDTRLGCNLGPWGDYLIDVCAELVRDYQVDGFSFDGNYHPAICYCPACKATYGKDKGRELPDRVNLDDIAYREYLVWRGERLEDHYRKMQKRLKATNRDAVLMSWTANAGRYGHFLTSPRVMSTRTNSLFDLPMQEWWLDETNQGGSLLPAFGAAYLKAVAPDRPCASEAYLMSRGNPYGTDSFPVHERLTRNLLALSQGNVTAESFGWPGRADSTFAVFDQVREREAWLTRVERLPWAALLVSEQTRQFYAYKDIPDRFLAPLMGVFRCATEEHLPLSLINDWDVIPATLKRYAVLILANAAALSDAQIDAIRQYVQSGGGLVASADTSLFDELGRPRSDFALKDVWGASYRGRPSASARRPKLDASFAITIDEKYWQQRTGVATLSWSDHPLVRDQRLQQLVPTGRVAFRGPLVRVEENDAGAISIWMTSEGTNDRLPAVVHHQYGRGRCVYFAAGVDAGLWSYAYPYQRRLLTRAIAWAARERAPITVRAPMCVQVTYFTQSDPAGRRLLVHLFNGVNTTGNHGLTGTDVPLREETVPISGIEVRFAKNILKRVHLEPGNRAVEALRTGEQVLVRLPPLAVHAILVGEY